jgi:DNA-binding transcriptional LysR family regulator
MIEMHHLRYFVALAETLHFGQAAQRIYISQPALSQQIRALESLLGVQLFDRNRQTVTLTHAGQLLLPEAQKALNQVDFAVRVAQRAAKGEIGYVSIGFVVSMLYSFLPVALRIFRERFASVDVKLSELSSRDQFTALKQRQLDIGFVHGPLNEPTLHSELVHRGPLRIALPQIHPLAGCKIISLRDLRDEPFVMVSRDREPAAHDRTISMCQESGFVPHIAQEASQIQTILELVALGIGVFLMPGFVCNTQHSGVACIPLIETHFVAEYFAVWREDDCSPVRQQFWTVVQEVMAMPDSTT